MKFVKKYKAALIIGFICVALVIAAGIFIKDMYFSSEVEDIYGPRLDGIEDMQISDETFNNLKESLLNEQLCTEISYHFSGTLINFVLTVKTDDINLVLNKIMDNFSDDEKGFYDFQVLAKNEDEKKENFPLLAYRHRSSKEFSITMKKGEVDDEE